jgi:hypothetical protein
MVAREVRWVVRLTPPTGRTIRDLLEIPLSLDVWHREKDALVAVASELTLRELERPIMGRRASTPKRSANPAGPPNARWPRSEELTFSVARIEKKLRRKPGVRERIRASGPSPRCTAVR